MRTARSVSQNLETLGFKLEAAGEIEQPPGLAFEVPHQPFVEDPVHAARLDPVEMGHEAFGM